MGLRVSIYKDTGRTYSNGGASEDHDALTLVNVDGPSEPTDDAPAAALVRGITGGIAKVVMVDVADDGSFYVHDAGPKTYGPMMGGSYVGTSDSRFTRAVEKLTGSKFYGAVPLHDRYETPREYAALSA